MQLSERTLDFYRKFHAEVQPWNEDYQNIPLDKREDYQLYFTGIFTDFKEFAKLGMLKLGFDLSDMQADIAHFMQHGNIKRMVQAQRSEAKTTIAALYAVWRVASNPRMRVTIVSSAGGQADDISTLITRLIMEWSILCWLRPDKSLGDRTSTKKFDVHRSLKGIDKSASIRSVGITGTITGNRADLVIADDIEDPNNSDTQTKREFLQEKSKEFSAICTTGEILYLGTPQTKDSIYKDLPRKGYHVRVWSGRYPTDEELARYGDGVEIAPYIMERLRLQPELQTGGGLLGNRGQVTDAALVDEAKAQDKEIEYGEEGYNLQFMLDTTLSDALRTKIKLSDMVVLGVTSEEAPETLQWCSDNEKRVQTTNLGIGNSPMYKARAVSEKYVKYQHKVMTLDPSGNGGDELSYAIGGATNSYIYVLGVGGFLGGTTEENINNVLCRMIESDTKVLHIEKNMGHGAVTALFIAQIEKLKLKAQLESEDIKPLLDKVGLSYKYFERALTGIGVSDYYVTGQKEKRIIDTIAPVTKRHKLVIAEQAIAEDWESCLRYPAAKRTQYSAFYQLGNITYDRGSLVHDDRADAIEALVRALQGFLSVDEEKAAEVQKEKDFLEWLDNPLGIPAYVRGIPSYTRAQNNSRGRPKFNRSNRGRR